VSFIAITLCIASQLVIIIIIIIIVVVVVVAAAAVVYFAIGSVRKLLDTPTSIILSV
jgi:flagellar basal body-associated protein FliL